MREIKFRVWDKECKYMHICGENIHDEITFTDDENKAYYYNLQNGEGSLTENSTYALMQYTGLKDKNGKEIYEGDILKDKWNTIYVVKYKNSGFYIYRNNGRNGYSKIASWNGTKEIIGNIYDNPELLEEEK